MDLFRAQGATVAELYRDSLWWREPPTVSRNASQARMIEELGDVLRFGCVVPPMGPFPLKDTFGMKIACVTFMKSLSGNPE
jgi:hypothetical protein